MVKTLKIDDVVHEKLTKIGRKGQTYSDVIAGLVGEMEWLPRLKAIAESGSEKIEQAKKDTRRHAVAVQAADELLRSLEQFIAAVEERSK